METLKDMFKGIKTEAKEAFKKSSNGETFSIAQAIAKAIIYAKENGLLPSILDSMTNTPEDIASISAKIAFAISTVNKLVTGDLNTYEKLLNHIIDIAYVIAVSMSDKSAQVGSEIVKNAAEIVVEFFAPGWGEIVGQYLEAFSNEITNAIKVLNHKVLTKIKCKTKNDIYSWFESLREKEEKEEEEEKEEKVEKQEDEEEEEVENEYE